MPPRVLVVDDSSYVRMSVARALEESGAEVVGFARDGEEAVERNVELAPDVVVLDLQMPRLDGVGAIRRMQATRPVPTLVFASMTGAGAELAVEALAEGAVDVVPKPAAGEFAVDVVARVWALASAHDDEAPAPPPQKARPRVALIGASTGGPPLVERILKSLDDSFPLPVVVAQHMPAGFTASFAKRLDSRTRLHVFEGTEYASIGPGDACILPGGAVSTLHAPERPGPARAHDFALRVSAGSRLPGARPSISALFFSGVGVAGGGVVAALLTGMGADGADAVPAIVAAGGTVLAQSPREAVIASMPNAAIAAGASDVLDVTGIAERFRGIGARRMEGRR